MGISVKIVAKWVHFAIIPNITIALNLVKLS